jgi:hypothetical protein
MLSRRGLLGTMLAAPAIVRTPGLLMPVKTRTGGVDLQKWIEGYWGTGFPYHTWAELYLRTITFEERGPFIINFEPVDVTAGFMSCGVNRV